MKIPRNILHYNANTSIKSLPTGYRIVRKDFPDILLYAPDGKYLGSYQFDGHAVNRAIRHSQNLDY